MPPYKYLGDDDIDALYKAAIECGLGASRGALLSGIDASYVAGLAIENNSASQVQRDLDALNAEEPLVDGTVPLHQWLSTALRLVGPRRQSKTFQQALDQVKAIAAGTESPAVRPANRAEERGASPGAGVVWDGRLSGADYQKLVDALVAAYPTPSSLQQMVLVQFDGNLAAITAGGNLETTAFELIGAAVAGGWIRQLVAGALEGKPGNPLMVAFARERGVERKS